MAKNVESPGSFNDFVANQEFNEGEKEAIASYSIALNRYRQLLAYALEVDTETIHQGTQS